MSKHSYIYSPLVTSGQIQNEISESHTEQKGVLLSENEQCHGTMAFISIRRDLCWSCRKIKYILLTFSKGINGHAKTDVPNKEGLQIYVRL
jgi:hypothetical protein